MTYISYWLFACITFRQKQLLIMIETIGLSIFFFEIVWTQSYVALTAFKAFGMPLTAHCDQWLVLYRIIIEKDIEILQ